jgi:hypothetical protein
MSNSIQISKDILAQELDGETVLLDLASDSFFGLDAVSTRVWNLLQDGADEGQIVDALLEEFEVGREVLEGDVAELLNQLEQSGLIRRG